jgi:hypothetical protein
MHLAGLSGTNQVMAEKGPASYHFMHKQEFLSPPFSNLGKTMG